MTKNNRLKQLSILAATVLTVSASPLASADSTSNPFGMTELSQGHKLAAAEGKCGEAKCGSSERKGSENKSAESKCGSSNDDKAAEGKCGDSKKDRATESKCGGNK